MQTHVGFTGSQRGMSQMQMLTVERLLADIDALFPLDTAHHGLCIGADADFHEIARSSGLLIEGHPPIKPDKRATWCQCDTMHEEKDYLDRNKDIVDASAYVIATPAEFEEQLRSGTWSTVRYARKQNKFVFVVLPDGSLDGKAGRAFDS